MKRLLLLILAGVAPLPAQMPNLQMPTVAPVSPLGQKADNPVVAIVEGRTFHKAELEEMVQAMGSTISHNFYNDKRAFLRTFGMMLRLADLARQDGLDKQGPYAWRLYYNNLLFLANTRAASQNSRIEVRAEEQKKYYDEHQLDFASAQVKVIYVNFNDSPPADLSGPKPRTSSAAEELAGDIVKQARAGADFAALVAKYSDDPESKGKQGDFTPIKPNDNSLPPQIKSAVFALKEGQVSDPVRQTGGFWIFRMQKFVAPAYDEVKDDVFKAIQEVQFRAWMDSVQKAVTVEFKDDKYLDIKTQP